MAERLALVLKVPVDFFEKGNCQSPFPLKWLVSASWSKMTAKQREFGISQWNARRVT